MHDVARLRRRAEAAYETGRLRFAGRVAGVVVPLTALCAWETQAVAVCALLGALLLSVAVALRWWRNQGVTAVSAGLRSGVLPMATALVVCRIAGHWPPHVAGLVCGAAGLTSGLLAGYAVARPAHHGWGSLMAVSVVAGLTAVLGCVGLGVGAAIGSAVGITIGVAAVAGRRHSRYHGAST